MRLKDTWQELPAKYLESYLELEKITNANSNYKAYRDILKNIKFGIDPVVPYIGLVMKDLISFDETVGPSVLPNSHVLLPFEVTS